MTEAMWQHLQTHAVQLEQLTKKLTALEADEETNTARMARWLPYPPPPAAEDKQHRRETPLFTIACFVQYYNATYTGRPGSRAIAIPDCWLSHPGLVAELATLTYTWRAAHLGRGATPRDAQYWHDRWRVGFAERLATEWVHAHCLADEHKPAGAPARADRFSDDNPPTRSGGTP
ncbi:hypothetical protein [Sciscionella marina]|uniref:hypothetical protein n=1 Tax=Sciscionella marina TaxID=508770 RepID=UPI0012F637CC|nr:hypothetical protein [Sciscionella marina]